MSTKTKRSAAALAAARASIVISDLSSATLSRRIAAPCWQLRCLLVFPSAGCVLNRSASSAEVGISRSKCIPSSDLSSSELSGRRGARSWRLSQAERPEAALPSAITPQTQQESSQLVHASHLKSLTVKSRGEKRICMADRSGEKHSLTQCQPRGGSDNARPMLLSPVSLIRR